MASRFLVLTTLTILAAAGCVTTTAHRLPISGNPLREEAIACEAKCQYLLGASACNATSDAIAEACDGSRPSDVDGYAACLDDCPGAMATDGASCRSASGTICMETVKPNWGGIAAGTAGGTAAIVTVVVAVAVVGGILGGLSVLAAILTAGAGG